MSLCRNMEWVMCCWWGKEGGRERSTSGSGFLGLLLMSTNTCNSRCLKPTRWTVVIYLVTHWKHSHVISSCALLYPGGVQWQPWREVDGRKPATVSRGYSWERGEHEELGKDSGCGERVEEGTVPQQILPTVCAYCLVLILLGNWQVVWWHELADCALFEGSPGVVDTSYQLASFLGHSKNILFCSHGINWTFLHGYEINLGVAWEPARSAIDITTYYCKQK